MPESNRKEDLNGWFEVKNNPLTKVGVFPYLGSQIDQDKTMGLDPNKIYYVYRSEEELKNPETINSFKLLPWTDEHEMLGRKSQGLTPAENKGIHGVIGEEVYYDNGYLLGNIKAFSEKLSDLIDGGKKELSLGYRCLYVYSPGVYNGERYDFLQKDMRGNHVALVDEGRAGHDVEVLDKMQITFDSRELSKMEENQTQSRSLETLGAQLDALSTLVQSMQGTKKEEAADVSPDDFVEKANILGDEDVDAEKKDDDKKDAEDADEEKKDDDKKDSNDAMDAMNAAIKKLQKQVKNMDESVYKSVAEQTQAKIKLADSLAKHIGTFDHSVMTLKEVEKYGVKKLGLKCEDGHENPILKGFLAAAKVASPVAMDRAVTRCDAIDSYLSGKGV